MSKLKPIGSEKLQGDEKLKRIMEIARYKEVIPNPINETSGVDYQVKLADGNTYEIAKEKSGYVIKKRIDESHSDYIEPMKNRRHYSSYSSAFKRLNLIAKEVNNLTETTEGISLFTEQKKYTLKTPTPKETEPEASTPPPVPEPAPAPAPVGGPSEPETSLTDMGVDMGPDAPEDTDMDMPEPSDDMPMDNEEDNDEVTFKSIQKLTGKLAQKIRDLQDQEEEISSKDAKYVVNSIISAISDNLDEDDKEDIIGKLEGEDEDNEFDMGDEDMGNEPSDEEMPSDDEETLPQPEGEMGEEWNEQSSEMEEEWNEGEVSEDDFLGKVFGNIFSESKVDKILKNYFAINENEKKFITEKKQVKKQINENRVKSSIVEINRLSESLNQRKVAKDIVKNFPEINFVGKTNKGNLVFENKNKQLKVSPSGKIL
jgi:hypothetical protein